MQLHNSRDVHLVVEEWLHTLSSGCIEAINSQNYIGSWVH